MVVGWSKHTAVLSFGHAAVGLAALVGITGARKRILWTLISPYARLHSSGQTTVTVVAGDWIRRVMVHRTTIGPWLAACTLSPI